MPAVTIRKAAREDTPAIARIINESWRAAYIGIVPQNVLDALSGEEKRRHLEAGLDRFPDMAYYLLEIDGAPVGAASLHSAREEDLPNAAEFSFFYLKPNCWRGGFGTLLLAHLLNEAKLRGFSQICCWTLEKNARAIAFYEKNGFVRDGAKQSVTIGVPLEAMRFLRQI